MCLLCFSRLGCAAVVLWRFLHNCSERCPSAIVVCRCSAPCGCPSPAPKPEHLLFHVQAATPALSHPAQLSRDATLWAPRHLPQNRDVFMVTGGDGSLLLHKYRYPDQRWVGQLWCFGLKLMHAWM